MAVYIRNQKTLVCFTGLFVLLCRVNHLITQVPAKIRTDEKTLPFIRYRIS
jgi:hypothetical protein